MFIENVSAIKVLVVKNLAGLILFHISSCIIDTKTKRLFEASIEQNPVPNLYVIKICRTEMQNFK